MPDLCGQISGPMDLRETAFSRGDATKGDAWTRFCRRLRAELGEDVFSSWFGCLELDALSGQHAYLSVPTKFLKRWIQLHYADRILVSLVSEFPAVKRVSINVRSSAQQATAPATNTYAERAIPVLVGTPEPKKIKIDDIQKRVASHFKVSRADILSSRRTAAMVHPRQIAMYLSKLLTPHSLPEIGRRFGRDHTTVLHAIQKIQGLIAADGTFSEEIDLLKRMLLE
jgi:chromosomal replication initiation ATPase DnaA